MEPRAIARGFFVPGLLGDWRILTIEVDLEDLADLDGPQDPLAVDEVTLRGGDDAVRLRERAIRVNGAGPGGPERPGEFPRRVRLVLEDDADDGQAVGRMTGQLRAQERHL